MQCPAAPTDGQRSASQENPAESVLVELGGGERLDVGLTARLALVVEAEHRARLLDAVVDLGHGDHEAVAGEPHRPAQ